MKLLHMIRVRLGSGLARLGLVLLILLGAAAFADARRVSSDSVLTTIAVGTNPLQMQLTPDGAKLLVSNEAADTVSVISTTTDAVVATISVHQGPGPIRITPNGQKAYVVNELSNDVSVINVATNSLIINVGVGTNPVTLSRSDDGAKVYVANKGSNNVSVICTGLVPLVCNNTDAIIGSPIAVGTAPNTMAKTPDGTKLYVANQTSNTVSVISTATDSVSATIALAPSQDPGSIHFLPNGTKAYVANRGCVAPAAGCPSTSVPPSVSVINVATNAVMATITGAGFSVGDAPHAMRITPDGSKLYVVNKHGDEVMVIDTGTDTILRFIQLQQGSCSNVAFGIGSCPVRIELTPDGSKAYVVEERPLAANGVLTVICTGIVPSVCGGTRTDTVVGSVALGASPTDIEIKNSVKAYVSNSLSNSVTVVTLVDVSYNVLLTFQGGSPGSYQNCLADIQHSGKNLTAKILCYFDSPSITVNPHLAAAGSGTMGVSSCPPADPKYCGDGLAGAPPPGCSLGVSCAPLAPNCPSLPCEVSQYQFADIETQHARLTGTLDNTSNTISLAGCFQDFDGLGQLGNVYLQAQFDANTGQGTASRYAFQSTANCTAGTPSGSPSSATVAAVRLAPGSDSDGDGCPDRSELSDNQGAGGLRDPLNRWDFFNPEKANTPFTQTSADILKVVQAFGKNQGNAAYRIDNDRTGLLGGHSWNLGPADGQQTASDILVAVKQFNQSCGSASP